MTNYVPLLVIYRILQEFGPFLIMGMALFLVCWRILCTAGSPIGNRGTNRRAWRMRRKPEGLRCPVCGGPLNRAAATEWCPRYPDNCTHFRTIHTAR